jgi:predicted aspartyl protease
MPSPSCSIAGVAGHGQRRAGNFHSRHRRSFSETFAQKAKVQIDQDSKVRMHTANGIVDAKRGRATTVQLRSLQAKDVAVVVHDAVRGSFGDGVDGLLGMSFLSRFKVSIDTQAIRIANRNAK